MNWKTKLVSVIIVVMLIACMGLPVISKIAYAEDGSATVEKWFGRNAIMTTGTPDMGYAINLPGSGGNTIWNIVQYPSGTSDNFDSDKNVYCLKEGFGFTDLNSGESTWKQKYDQSANMVTQRDIIKNQYSPNEVGQLSEENYNSILALLDMAYLLPDNDLTKRNEMLDILTDEISNNPDEYIGMNLDFIGDAKSKGEDYMLTPGEIKAVQQAAVWYFTNGIDKTKDNPSWFYYTTTGNNYETMNNYNKNNDPANYTVGNYKATQANVLYRYLIKTAKANASKFATAEGTNSGVVPATINKDNLAYTENGENYIVGPIKSTENGGSIDYTITIDVKGNSTSIKNYKVVNKSGEEITTSLKELAKGDGIYVSIPKSELNNDITKLAINVNVNYNDTTLTMWAASNSNNEQPLVEIEKGPKTETTPLTPVPPTPTKEEFDLKLIKHITEVNGKEVPDRIESIDVSKLNIDGSDSKTTADYKLNKNPVPVESGDIVTYTFNIFNEGMIDGYAQVISEDVPEGLEFIYSEKTGDELKADTTLSEAEKEAIEFNHDFAWGFNAVEDMNSDGKITKIYTDYLSKDKELTPGSNLLKAFGKNDGTKTEKDLRDNSKQVSVKFKVVSKNINGVKIRNEAAITKHADKDGNSEGLVDRDSQPEVWEKKDPYQDDEDYDVITLQSFDLALRKFIVAVSDDEKIEDSEYLRNANGTYTRAPEVDTSKLDTAGEDGKLITTATYNHPKNPILVGPGSKVVYMIRVYNEGDVDGYASEIKDHLPPYLTYLDNEFNKQNGWQVSDDGRTVTTRYLEDKIISKKQAILSTDGGASSSQRYELKYQEVPIMCEVNANAKTNENITNIADITEYKDENKQILKGDRDSEPNNIKLPGDENLPNYKGDKTGVYIPGDQDDDDFEKVVVKVFDLALRKWVTEAIVIENGQQTVNQTGHQPYDDPEQIVKVELHRKKLDQVTVKFRYSIRVINEGEIEGYAKEVTDYVPAGLKFVAEDNPGWTDEGNNVISTRALENTLLQPGEYADVDVLLTWENSEDNMGVMVNKAEISEDDNPYGIPDKDSTPDNQKEGEDDIDDAPVMLSISTGQMRVFFTLGFIVLLTASSGVFLIKKYVI